MRRAIIAMLGIGLLASCTPADEEYCQKYDVGGTPEFGKCLSYYHGQDDWFKADYAACSRQADQTYPRSLYSNGGYVPVISPFGAYGYPHTEYAYGEPDYRHNAEVDALRLRIIGPCMNAKGWNSPKSWQAGRHGAARVSKAPVKAPTTEVDAPDVPPSSLNSLPWLQ